MLTNGPCRGGRYSHLHKSIGGQVQRCVVSETILEQNAGLSMQPGESEKRTRGDEVVPTAQLYQYSLVERTVDGEKLTRKTVYRHNERKGTA